VTRLITLRVDRRTHPQEAGPSQGRSTNNAHRGRRTAVYLEQEHPLARLTTGTLRLMHRDLDRQEGRPGTTEHASGIMHTHECRTYPSLLLAIVDASRDSVCGGRTRVRRNGDGRYAGGPPRFDRVGYLTSAIVPRNYKLTLP